MDDRALLPLKLPRKLEEHPRRAELEAWVSLSRSDLQPLWKEGRAGVLQVPLTAAFEAALVKAFRFKQLERGLEHIQKLLEAEKRGIDSLQKRIGNTSSQRISRLLVIANDGSERFYRSCEQLRLNHAERLFLIRLDVNSERLALELFGGEKPIKALLVSDKEGVSQVLLSLLEKRS